MGRGAVTTVTSTPLPPSAPPPHLHICTDTLPAHPLWGCPGPALTTPLSSERAEGQDPSLGCKRTGPAQSMETEARRGLTSSSLGPF